MLEYGVDNRAGFTVITGEIGSGKTTLIRHLLNNLPESVTVGYVTNTHKNITNILEWVMQAFGQQFNKLSNVGLYDVFQKFLITEYTAGRRVILIVDEGQNLSPDVLEELRILSNINADKHQLLQLIVTGQPELKALLCQPELKQFAQRIAVDFHLNAFTDIEVALYIKHRLAVSGRTEELFTAEACKAISKFSKGIPRSINILCDTAMVYGMSSDAELIDESVIEEIIRDRQEFGVLSQNYEEKAKTDG
jgi:type II secretory pathway predicted ATPase ExeA